MGSSQASHAIDPPKVGPRMDSDSYVYSYVDDNGHEIGGFAYRPAGIPAEDEQKFNSCVENVTNRSQGEPGGTAQQTSLPVVENGAVEARKPRRKTGRRGKAKDGERAPREPAVTVAETPSELRDLILLTREQAAVLAGVGLNKIDEWSREPGFPVIKEGGHFVRIVRAPFEEWLTHLAERLNPPEYRPRPRDRKRP